MAIVVDQKHQIGRTLYPWSDWANGERWLLKQGVDYDVSTQSMRRAVHAHARKIGRHGATKAQDDGLLVQFEKPKRKKLLPRKKK